MQLFKASSEKQGFGVFTANPIASNTFVLEYLGERINIPEACRRERLYSKMNPYRGNYLCYIQRSQKAVW